MYRRHRLVGGGGEDGAGLDGVARTALGEGARKRRTRRHRPALPQAGEGEGRAVPEPEQPGLAGLAFAPPLIEPVGRDQAAAMAEGRPERRLLRGGLGPGVDELSSRWPDPSPRPESTPSAAWRASGPHPRRARRRRPGSARRCKRGRRLSGVPMRSIRSCNSRHVMRWVNRPHIPRNYPQRRRAVMLFL